MSRFNLYANSIRNKPKRDYAFAYLAWLKNGSIGPEPDKPVALSYMAAQAVRQNLQALRESCLAGALEATQRDFVACGLVNPLAKDQAELARRQAAAPLKPPAPQRPCDVGLFSDESQQLDLVDMARRK
jgi:hypothetical protein